MLPSKTAILDGEIRLRSRKLGAREPAVTIYITHAFLCQCLDKAGVSPHWPSIDKASEVGSAALRG